MTNKATHQASNHSRVIIMPVLFVLLLLEILSSVTGTYGFAFLPSRHHHTSYSPAKIAADAALKNAQQQTPSFVRRYAPAAVALLAETSKSSLGAGSAKNASEVSHEEIREYRNAMSISRTEGKANGGSDTKVRVRCAATLSCLLAFQVFHISGT
jgi:hypothetical protein